MREKRILILITVALAFAMLFLIFLTKDGVWQGIFTGVFTSALVALVLVISEYQMQKNQALKCVFQEVFDIQDLLVKHYQEIDQKDDQTEALIMKCMSDIPTSFFTQHTLHAILAHAEDQVAEVAHEDSFINLLNYLISNGSAKSFESATTQALAMLSSRIKRLFIGIDLFIKIAENGRRQRVDQAFLQLNFFLDLFTNNILFCLLTGDKKALQKASLSRFSKIEKIQRNLWDPIMSMLASVGNYTITYFEPFMRGYDLMPLHLLYDRYLSLQHSAFFLPWWEGEKDKANRTRYSVYIRGITNQLILFERFGVKPHIFGIKVVDFVRKRKRTK